MDHSLAFLIIVEHSYEHKGLGLHNADELLGLLMEKKLLASTLNEPSPVLLLFDFLGLFSPCYFSAGCL